MLKPSRGPQLTLLAAFAAVYIIWGSTYLAIRFADASMPPLLMGGTRFVIAGGILFVIARLTGGAAARPTFANWRATGIVGAFLLLGGNGIVIVAEKVVPSALAALLVSISPLWMMLIDWLRPKGVRPTAAAIVGIVIGFGGVALLLGPNITSVAPTQAISFLIIPFAAFCWASGSIYARQARLPANPVLSNGMEMLVGGALLLIAALATGEWSHIDLAAITAQSYWAWGYLIVFGSIVGFSAYTYILKHAPLAMVSTYAYVNPIVAVFLGVTLAGEAITPLMMIAAAIIIGAVMVIMVFRKHPTPPTIVAAPTGDVPTIVAAPTDDVPTIAIAQTQE